MRKQTRTILGSLLAAALLLGSLTSTLDLKGAGKPPPPTYRYGYTNLGQVGFNNFGGGVKAYGLSEPDSNGVLIAVGGGSSTPSPNYDAVWVATSSGALISADTLPNSTKSTVAVNDLGMIAYYGYSASQATNVGMVEVPGAGTVELSYFRPTALNNLGQVAGYYQAAAREGELVDIAADGTITGWTLLGDFVPFAINDLGEMAGQQGSLAAIAWFEDGVLQVQTLPGLFAGNYGRAAGINNLGEVVGVSASSSIGEGNLSGYYRPFRWDSVMGLIALNSNTNEQSGALDINDRGQIVGWAINSSYYAFLWENGKLSDLNALSGVGTKAFRLGSAESINNAGHIVGRSDAYQGKTTVGNGSYLLTPK